MIPRLSGGLKRSMDSIDCMGGEYSSPLSGREEMLNYRQLTRIRYLVWQSPIECFAKRLLGKLCDVWLPQSFARFPRYQNGKTSARPS